MGVYCIPKGSLVVLMGPAGSGKSTFARKNFADHEIVSSDQLRYVLTGDMNDQDANSWVFKLFHQTITYRLTLGGTTVADATNVTKAARKDLLEIADARGVPAILLIFDTPIDECRARNATRDRQVPEHVIERHYNTMEQNLKLLKDEKWSQIIHVADDDQILCGHVATGWDIIGDVHGCVGEFTELLDILGYRRKTVRGFNDPVSWYHPEGRKIALIGDLVDRGPASGLSVLLAKELVDSGYVMVQGNHDNKLRRFLQGNKVKASDDLMASAAQVLEHLGLDEAIQFLDQPYQLKLSTPGYPDVIISHAGIRKADAGRGGKRIDAHCIYGEVVSSRGDDGYPVRGRTWEKTWDEGPEITVFGHIVHKMPYKSGNIRCVDTGAVFGGMLTAYQYPEDTFSCIRAFDVYREGKELWED